MTQVVWKPVQNRAPDLFNFIENFSFDYDTVYVGVMSPEENMIVILQNVLMFIYSSIGYVMLLPFYQVRNVKTG